MLTSMLFLAFTAFALAAPSATTKNVKCAQLTLDSDYGRQLFLVNSAKFPPGKNQTKLPDGGINIDNTLTDGRLIKNEDFPNSYSIYGFETCNSTYMGWKTQKAHDNTETHYFGHLGTTDTEGEGLGFCFHIAEGKTGSQLVIASKCSKKDDKSQLDQWWTIIVPKDSKAPIIARFIGQRESTYNANEYYDLHPSKFDGNFTVASTFHKTAFRSNYDFQLNAAF